MGRRNWWIGLWLPFAAAALPAAAAQPIVPATTPATLPPATFFAPAAIEHATLSPSGRHLAWLERLPGGRVGLRIVDLEGVDTPVAYQASATDDFASLRWADADWLLFTLRDTELRRFRAARGGGLMALRRDGKAERVLVARGPVDMPPRALFPDQVLVALGPPGSQEIILARAHHGSGGVYSHTTLTALNIDTQAARRYHEDAPRASSWWFDDLGRPRIIAQEDGERTRLLWAPLGASGLGGWREIATMPWLAPTWAPAWVEGDNDLQVFTLDGKGHAELRRFDFEAGRPAATARMGTPGFSGALAPRRAGRGGRLLGVDVLLDAWSTEWLSPEMQALQARVDARLPGRVNLLQCGRCEQPRDVLVYSYADVDPGRWLLWRPATGEWQLLGAAQPQIDPQRMARTEFLRVRARDGSDLPVWVTRPRPGAQGPAPAVVLVHGGPHLRGMSWHWDAGVQFLASRGYVVIQPEFRGSVGYGDAHYRAGWKQYGGAMIDDITDALRHAAAQGWADEKRACIMGASYGGYATLMSLVKEPVLYRCGIAHAAVTDLRHQFDFHWSDISWLARRDVLPHFVGDPKKDAGMFVATSPLEQVQRIQAPILLMHGDDDRRVPIENGERMRDALKKAGKPHEWVVFVDEGHRFSTLSSELDYWRRVETFLAKHLH